MKAFLLFIIIVFYGCNTHPCNQPHKHLIKIPYSGYTEYCYITSDIVKDGGCVNFTYIDNYDFVGLKNKTVCGNFTIEY